MGKKNKWESLLELGVQEISNQGHFSSDNLEWTPIGDGGEMDLCVAIPFERLSHFITGEVCWIVQRQTLYARSIENATQKSCETHY